MKITGYAITVKSEGEDKMLKHMPNGNVEVFPYVIFPSLEQAKRYATFEEHSIRKCTIKINKKDLK